MNCGNLVAGVIGKTKFIYDIWGDTVNVASRMESTGTPGCIHVTQEVWERSHDEFSYGSAVEIEVKGKGLMKTYLLGEPAADAVPSPADASPELRSATPAVEVPVTEEAATAEAPEPADEPPEGYTPISLDEIFAAREKEKGAATKGPEPAAPEAEASPAADAAPASEGIVPVDVAASTVFGPASGFRPVHRTGKGLLATCMKRNEEENEDNGGKEDAGRE